MTTVCASKATLVALLGPGGVVADDDRQRYETGYRFGAGRALAIVRPANIDEVRTVVRHCRENRWPLVIQGAHTGLVGAATPGVGGNQIVLSLERLRDVRIDAHSRSATCGAGTLLSSLNAAAAEHGLMLPIDLGADPSIGGMVATNTGGARLIRYGGMRESVLGIQAVLLDANATIIDDMRGLRKNNVGVDLKQLLIGAGGQSAIITAVECSLQPVIRQSATALAVPTCAARIPEIISVLEASLGPFLTACEGMSANAMRAALDHHPAIRRPFADFPEYVLLIEAGSSIDSAGVEVAALLENALARCMADNHPLLSDALLGRGGAFWALRHSITDGLKASGRVVGFDVAVRRDRLWALRDDLTAMIDSIFPDATVCDFGHVADGGMHFNCVVPRDFPAAGIALLRDRVFELVVERHGGSFSAEHSIGPANRAQYERYRPATERALIDGISRLVDPRGLLR